MHSKWFWSLAAYATGVLALPPVQVPLRSDNAADVTQDGGAHVEKKRPLHGRFLHVTDFHPDRFYQVYSSTAEEAACHRGQGPAGIYGAETSECDSPIELINKTMEWIRTELKDKIDFIIWTGDSARHDNDEEIPRNAEQVVGLNEMMVEKMFEVFGKRNGDEDDEDPNNDFVIPIVPSFGNNDILPHNVMARGPNTWTRTYARVWRRFIPEAQKHQFEQGGWFYVEVIPNKLAVFSLNSLYFATNNAAVDGCAASSEPGYQQLEWLRIQLQFMRDRGVKAILTAHQPPIRQDAKALWEETCWQKYTLWLRQYRDVIVSSHYGHFNFDHFLLQDFKDLEKDTKDGMMPNYHIDDEHDDDDDDVSTAVSLNYWLQIRDQYSELPKPPKSKKRSVGEDDEIEVTKSKKSKGDKDKKKKKKKSRDAQKRYLKKMGGPYAERFAASFVSASIVPNLYPALRVFEYNVTGLDRHNIHGSEAVPPAAYFSTRSADDATIMKKKKTKKNKFVVPDAPSKSSSPGPAYSPQPLSLVKYTQYYANITHINNDFHTDALQADGVDWQKWKEGKHKGRKPHDKDHEPRPKKFQFDVHYDTRDDDVYQLPDLTMPSIIDLARRIGNFKAPEADEVQDELHDDKDDDEDDDDEETDYEKEVTKKKGKKHHSKPKHGKRAKHTKRNLPWYTFIDRAFLSTRSPDEIEEDFGY